MHISKLEIFGFKSFPEKTRIEFAEGVSAIVGPNGTGKSNIVDALRWVLGVQGDKILRSEKRDDIVFNGTRTRKPLSIAEVSLTINNSKRIIPLEYSEVNIARRFYRSGDTEYFMNGVRVRLKDIRNAFANTGIGPDAYSVIELKMVETILSPLKNERRKMFEEAAGIVTYKQNRDLTYKKLESVKESLARVTDIIREKQRNINTLERQVKKNEEAKNVYEELKKLEIITGIYEYGYLLKEISDIKEHESSNINLKTALQEEIQKDDAIHDNLLEQISRSEPILNLVNDRVSEKKSEIDKIERLNIVISQEIKYLEGNIERLMNENTGLTENIEKGRTRIEELTNKIAVLRNTLIVSGESLEEKKKKLDDTIESITEKKNELTHLGGKIKTVNKLLNDRKREYGQNKVKFDSNLDRMKSISGFNEKNLQQVSELEQEKSELKMKLKDTEEIVKTFEKLYNSRNEEIGRLKTDIRNKEEEKNKRTILLEKQKSRISYLKNLMGSFEDYIEGINFLLNEKQYDNITTVTDTIEVQPEYKFAVEVALGEVSNYLVLNDSRLLFRLIENLNEADKGKVTFILNDKLSGNFPFYFETEERDTAFLKDKNVLGFADNFVKCKKKEYEKLIKYMLDEYIIVRDIDTAFRLSKDNYYKFVTLSGDIVTDGVVRAGGKISEDTLKIGRKERITCLNNEVNLVSEELAEISNEIQNLQTKLAGINIDETVEQLSVAEKEKAVLNNKINLINFKIDSLDRAAADNKNLYKKIQSENDTLNISINSLLEEIDKVEVDNANLEKEFSFISNEFEEIERTLTDCQNDYNSFNMEIIKLGNELKIEESALTRISGSLEQQSRQLISNNSNIESDKISLEQKRIQLESNNGILGKLNEEQKLISVEYNKIKSELDSLREKQQKINIEQRTRRNQFEKVSQKLIDAQILMREYAIKSEQIKEYILKKYEYGISETDTIDISDPLIGNFIDAENTFNISRCKKYIDELSERLKNLGGGYQQLMWDSFQSEKDELQKIIDQKNDLIDSEKYIKKTIDRINKEARDKFLTTFELIKENFIKIFKELFQEGDEANLKLIYEQDENGRTVEDPLEARIEITAKPRQKRPTSIELLSGGEKTLTAIALLFAIYLVKPSPFCVLDEVDAPLDPANLARFNKMVRKFSSNTQFILITHNERTMESVDRLYGVTMQEPGVTTIVETKFKT
ncbi:MAG: chromosome segregation protein SMC [Ignavibacteria bacterium]|nr:chromosome segregation protein SMC [Ignavibacteria bacterium]